MPSPAPIANVPPHTPQLSEPGTRESPTPAAFDTLMVEEKFHVELSRIQLQIEDLQEQLRHAEEEHQSVVIRRYMYRLAKEIPLGKSVQKPSFLVETQGFRGWFEKPLAYEFSVTGDGRLSLVN
ncbi:hypothetical protein K443DRAFT_126649 [Laccaria amethystina LaAM-08-1]|uniref:Unplaced genomic scaffold K443scaffold_870, whole genome shotgun sequence n=1 Tax=Laccaria amethystina LaAM-08-1 TaxID=1095629 RepID=A0A0C9WZP3_9AGAR|nr:hypothetical protein K443DRAFT_126649 [Laccaria amethystina LaAM-08-1]